MQLQEVINPENCQHEEISKSAFENSNLQNILIPPQVKTIKESAFLGCRLQEIEIPKESKLEIIEKNAFFNTSFETIYIPSNIIELKEGRCCYLRNLTSFTIASKFFKSYEDKYIIGNLCKKKMNSMFLFYLSKTLDMQ